MSKMLNHVRADEKGNLNGINILERRYLGKGRFYQRGHFKDIQEGDHFYSWTQPKLDYLVVDKSNV